MTEFCRLTSTAVLRDVIEASARTPAIVFKHSSTCGVSLMARELLAAGEVPAPVHEISVQRDRALSDEVASTLGVRHESPQVLVIASRRVTWHSSHAGVTPERVTRAWREAVAHLTALPSR